MKISGLKSAKNFYFIKKSTIEPKNKIVIEKPKNADKNSCRMLNKGHHGNKKELKIEMELCRFKSFYL